MAAKLLGHEDPDTTLIYTHTDPRKVLGPVIDLLDAEFAALPKNKPKEGESDRPDPI